MPIPLLYIKDIRFIQKEFEFTDKHMKIKNIKLQGNKTYKLGDILEHDILFTVYPELPNYDVKIRKSKANGSFNNKDRAITLNTDISKNKKLTEGTLIYEIQHAIQHLEGFEAGKSSKKVDWHITRV